MTLQKVDKDAHSKSDFRKFYLLPKKNRIYTLYFKTKLVR